MWLSGEKSVKNIANSKCLVCLRKTREPGVSRTERRGSGMK